VVADGDGFPGGLPTAINANVTSYAYDALSRQTKVLNTAIQASPLLQQGYTPDGMRASLTDANGNTTSFAYDGFDRLATTTYPGGGGTETLTYDTDGNSRRPSRSGLLTTSSSFVARVGGYIFIVKSLDTTIPSIQFVLWDGG
jgi:YD repeat-containing protein